jgi:hypothetical protein
VGPPGQQGPAAAPPEYGIAAIDVTRGGSTTLFAAYSTALGSPVADTTGGVFRFSCSAAQAPCLVSVKAAALSDTDVGGTVVFYPRVLITKDDETTSPIGMVRYCEYADGTGGPGGLTALSKQPLVALPAYESVQLDIGGSADCFSPPGPGGVVASISLPEGRYNVDASFAFV